MGLMLTAPQQTTKFYREPGATEAIEQTAEEREQITYPPDNQYVFSVTGVSEPFQMEKSAEFGGGTQTMIRLEFEIAQGKAQGRRFQSICSCGSIGPKSNLRKLWNAAQLPIDDGQAVDITDLIGCTVQGYVSSTETMKDGQPRKRTNVGWDTLKAWAPKAGGTGNAASDDTWD